MMQLSVVHRTLLALVVCVAAWGSVFPSAKLVLVDMDGLSLAMWRFLFSVAGLAAYCLWMKMPLPRLRWWQYAALAVAGMVGGWASMSGSLSALPGPRRPMRP